MPILLLFILALACAELPWPDPLEMGLRGAATTTMGFVLFGWCGAILLSRWVQNQLRTNPHERSYISRSYGRGRLVLYFLNLGLLSLAIIGFGWGNAVWSTFTLPDSKKLMPFGELLVPGPYFLILFMNWIIYYPAERAMHESSTEGGRPFWSLAGYWVFHARQFSLLLGVPLGLFVGQQTTNRFFPEITTTWWYQGICFLGLLVLFLGMPRAMKLWFGLRSMPKGAARSRMEALARRMRVSITDILLWPTSGIIANAMIMGAVRKARYVVFTDKLMDSLTPEETNAVLGHELGHARHGHVPFYMLFFLLSSAAGMGLMTVVVTLIEASGWDVMKEVRSYLAVPPMLGMAAWLFVVFGYLSRVCERQADIAGARAGSCGNPNCTGHNQEVLDQPYGPLCPTGIRAMIQALEYVSAAHGRTTEEREKAPLKRMLAWMRAWQHGPIRSRVEFLYRLINQPQLAQAHDRKAFLTRLSLFCLLCLLILAAMLALQDIPLEQWFSY